MGDAITNDGISPNSFIAFEDDTAQATLARYANRVMFSIEYDDERKKIWEQEARPLLKKFAQLSFKDYYSEAVNLLNESLKEIDFIVCRSDHFNEVNSEVDTYIDNALDEYFNDNEEALYESLREIFSYEDFRN